MLRLYFDHNVQRAVAQGLRLRGVDLLTSLEDGTERLPDPELLDRAMSLGRVLFSMDIDLVIEAERRQHEGVEFAGVLFARQGTPIGLLVEELEIVAAATDPDEMQGALIRLPLR
jgi:hypothetical protein